MSLQFLHAPKSWGGLLRPDSQAPARNVRLRPAQVGPRICISNSIPGAEEAAGLGPHSEDTGEVLWAEGEPIPLGCSPFPQVRPSEAGAASCQPRAVPFEPSNVERVHGVGRACGRSWQGLAVVKHSAVCAIPPLPTPGESHREARWWDPGRGSEVTPHFQQLGELPRLSGPQGKGECLAGRRPEGSSCRVPRLGAQSICQVDSVSGRLLHTELVC